MNEKNFLYILVKKALKLKMICNIIGIMLVKMCQILFLKTRLIR